MIRIFSKILRNIDITLIARIDQLLRSSYLLMELTWCCAAVSLLAEADKLDTLDLSVLGGGLIALRGVMLEHKPGVGGALRRGPGHGARRVMRTETVGTGLRWGPGESLRVVMRTET